VPILMYHSISDDRKRALNHTTGWRRTRAGLPSKCNGSAIPATGEFPFETALAMLATGESGARPLAVNHL